MAQQRRSAAAGKGSRGAHGSSEGQPTDKSATPKPAKKRAAKPRASEAKPADTPTPAQQPRSAPRIAKSRAEVAQTAEPRTPASIRHDEAGSTSGDAGSTPALGSSTQKRKVGRPSALRPEFLEQVVHLCRLGATDLEIADFFKVDVRTVYRWQSHNPEFRQARKTGKDAADERVERSLYARANGYEHEEVDIRVVNGEIVQTPIRKFYPPDTTAGIFWLKNRRSQEWRDQQEVQHTGAGGAALLVTFVESDSTKGSSE